jgi:hypothetical protein
MLSVAVSIETVYTRLFAQPSDNCLDEIQRVVLFGKAVGSRNQLKEIA